MSKHKKEITVLDALCEYMKYLGIKATRSKGKERQVYLDSMNNMQVLLSRLGEPSPEDPYLSRLLENQMFLQYSYESKILILEHTRQIIGLRNDIIKLLNKLEEGHEETKKRLAKSIGWRFFKFFSFLDWGRGKGE